MATKKAGGGEILKLLGKAGSARKSVSKSAFDESRTGLKGPQIPEEAAPRSRADVIEFDKDYRNHPDWRRGMSKEEVQDMMMAPRRDEDGVMRKRGGKVEVGKVGGKKSGKRYDRRRRK